MAKSNIVSTNGDLGEKVNEGKKKPLVPKISVQPYKPKYLSLKG